ncbi:DUF4238 domain-containing protein [Arthrobacter crystallopoietes]|uniref:DUF4238 domain-containing protein n=1 Tax=Crystallibacter crystallopoietes TaxID=37928 RepID=UPI0009F4A206|nr:DUF4238 domain-containing protein [Arthrobacter crystallopoietes]
MPPDPTHRLSDSPTGRTKQRSPKAIGFVPNFVKHRSQEAEELWQSVESHLPAVFTSLDAGTLAQSPEHYKTIADCVALHFARSIESRRIHDNAVSAAKHHVFEDQDKLKQLALAKHGLHLDAPAILGNIATEVLADLNQTEASGELFQEWIEEVFHETRRYLAGSRVSVHHTDTDVEFLLGDCPAIGIGPNMHPMHRVPLYEATAILMPLGPKALAMLDRGASESPSDVPVQGEFAFYMNRAQVAQAHRQVYYRPSSSFLAGLARAYRPPRKFRTSSNEPL